MTLVSLRLVLLIMIAASLFFSGQGAQAQTFQVIYNFTGVVDGAYPLAGVTVDRSGNLYCTTQMGGIGNRGTVCRLSRQGSGWVYKLLYSFAGPPDASAPIARVVIGPDGSLYGTTEFGGRNCGGNAGCGTVYRLQPPVGICRTVLCYWRETLLYRFSGGGDGANPGYGDIVFDTAGNLYGTTFFGGINAQGVVFKLTRSGGDWSESAIHQFTGGDGTEPFSGVIFDAAGDLYGTTSSGGANGFGSVYMLSPSGSGWTINTLYSFQLGASGDTPYGGVVFDHAGNLYGATSSGGSDNGGTVYELAAGNRGFDLVYSFPGSNYQPGPHSSLAMDSAGNLYGTTQSGGANGLGSVFKLTRSGGGWLYTSLHDFSGGADGAYPIGELGFDAAGNLFGTAKTGGAQGYGLVWEITP